MIKDKNWTRHFT